MTNNYEDSVMKYRKKPVVIEAAQWFKNGDHPLDYSRTHDGFENGSPRQFSPEEREANSWEGDIVRYYRHPEVSGERTCKHCGKNMHDHGWIDTLEGGHIVCPGDWIITGIEGEHYPVKNAIFLATYESDVQPSTKCPGAGCTDQGCPSHYANNYPFTPDVAKLVKALEEISQPVRFMRERLGEGEQLNGVMAVQLAQDAEYLKDIAIAALEAYHKQGDEGVGETLKL